MLSSDLLACRNALRTSTGREALLGQVILLLCIAGAVLLAAWRPLHRPDVIEALRGGGEALATALGVVVVAALVTQLPFATPMLRVRLFRAELVPLWMTAPVSANRLVLRVLLRGVAGSLLFACAVGFPALTLIGRSVELPWVTYALLPVALALLACPLVAGMICVGILRTWLVRGPAARRVLLIAWISLWGCVVLAFVSGGFDGVEGRRRFGGWMTTMFSAVDLFDAPVGVLMWSRGRVPGVEFFTALGIIAAFSAVAIGCSAWLYRRAYEAYLVAGRSESWRRVSAANAPPSATVRWPLGVVGSLLAKTRAESLRARSNLLSYVVLFGLILIVVARAEAPSDHRVVPVAVREGLDMVRRWMGFAIVIGSLTCLAVIGDEQPRIALWVVAPVSRGRVLLGKLCTAAIPLLLTVVVYGVGSWALGGRSIETVAVFVGFATAIALALVGVIAVAGTWPRMVRVHEELPIAHDLRAAVPVIAFGGSGIAIMTAMVGMRQALIRGLEGEGWLAGIDAGTGVAAIVLAAWGLAALIGWGGFVVGRRNLCALLGPQE